MEFNVRKKTFLKALSRVQSVVEKRAVTPSQAYVLLKVSENSIDLTALDHDMTIIETFPATIQKTGSACVSGNLLHDIVKRIEDDEVLFFSTDIEVKTLYLKLSRSEFKLPLTSGESFPSIYDIPTENEFEIAGDELLKILESVRVCMSADEARIQLNGVLLEVFENKITAAATDMYRIGVCRTNEVDVAFNPIIVGRKTINEVCKILSKEVVRIKLSDSKIVFDTNDEESHVQLVSRLISGQFPKYKELFEQEYQAKAIIEIEKLESAIERVALVSNDKMRSVKFNFSKNLLSLSANSYDLGFAKEEVNTDYDGEPTEIIFNASYLQEIAKKFDCQKVVFSFNGPHSAVLIKPLESEDPRYIIMPLTV